MGRFSELQQAYMSPEQARGEGHRVDRRSDIFSLGVVFYELLAGRGPFQAETVSELLEQIATLEPQPPRQINDSIPKELERICLKALAKRASERYTTAEDLADDLNHFLSLSASLQPADSMRPAASQADTAISLESEAGADTPPATPTSDSRPIKIVPKGLAFSYRWPAIPR